MSEPERKPDLSYTAWTAEELDTLSAFTDQDIELAKAAVRQASRKLARLMDAEPDNGATTTTNE